MSTCSKCPRAGQLRRGLCKACYEKMRERQTAYGRWSPDRTPAGPARDHVSALRAAGVPINRIPELSGVPRSVIQALLYGRPRRAVPTWIRQSTSDRILAVAIPDDPTAVRSDHDIVPAVGAQRRIRALVADGWTLTYLAGELGMSVQNLSATIYHREYVSAARHRAIAALFGRLQMTPGPSNRARAHGARRQWPLPMQWDEDALDNPAAPTPPSTLRRETYRQVSA